MSRTNPVDVVPDGAEPVEETASGLVVPLTDDGKERKAMTFGWAAGEELTEREQVLEDLRQANLTGIKELAQQGILFDPAMTGQLLIDAIVDTIAPDGSPQRVEFFIGIELKVAERIEAAPEEARKQRLAAAAEAARRALAPGGTVPGIPDAVRQAAARQALEVRGRG